MAKAESPPEADSLDEQISALLESIAPQPQDKEIPARRRSLLRSRNGSRSSPAQPPTRKQAKAKGAKTHRRPPPKPRAQARARRHARPRERGRLFADRTTRERAFFVIAGIMIGALVGVLVALASS